MYENNAAVGFLTEFLSRQIQLEVVLISADPREGTMTLDWNIMGEIRSPCSPSNLTACTSVNIFFDKQAALVG